jgi:hypothetical protein
MVADLEHVDRRDQPALDEQPLDRRLRVAGQQRRESAVAHERDDRAIVDVAFGQRQECIGFGRVDDLEAGGCVEVEDRAGTGQSELGLGLDAGIGQELVVGMVVVADARVEHRVDPVAGQHMDQPGHMILVRMAEEHELDAASEEGERSTHAPQRELGVGPAVDERGGTGRCLDEDRVALADVQDGQVQAPVGP